MRFARIIIILISSCFITLASAQNDDFDLIEGTRLLSMKDAQGICNEYAPRLKNNSSYDNSIGVLWVCLAARDRGSTDVQNGIALSLLDVIEHDEYNGEFDIDFDWFLAASIINDLIFGSTVMIDAFADYEDIESVLANGALLTNRPDYEEYCTYALNPCIFDITTGENFVSSRFDIGFQWRDAVSDIQYDLKDVINGRR